MLKSSRAGWVCLLLIFMLLLAVGCGGGQQAADEPIKGPEAGAEQEQAAEEPFKVAFIYVGPVGDAGWSYAHDQGKKYMEKELPNVVTTIVESVPEGADAERVLTQLAEQGNKVIFATSFGYMDYVIKVAEKYPDVVFMHATGYKTAPNAGNYFGRAYQARYLTGLVAGKMTKTNKIGYVAAHPIPEVIRGINAFTVGVREVNPDAVVKVVWTNTWYDPAAEKEAGLAVIEAGADVVAQHQDTPGPQQAAEEKGVYGIGYNTDMRSFAPKANLTSPVWNWGPYYTKVVKEVMEGTWQPEAYWGGIKDGIIDIGPYGPMVPEEVKQLVAERRQLIIDEEWDVFWGPVKDQSGEVRVPEGSKMTDEEMLSFDWFVEGVDGTIPK
ncbi:MAG: BMP family ABC transporter substrate-binding protein [Bacillota bacterium]|jgi:basic membrane protein A